MKKNHKGFGIIETLIAMALVAVLSTVGYASYQDHQAKVQEEKVQKELLTLMSDYGKYYAGHGSYTDEKGYPPRPITDAIIREANSKNSNYIVYTYPGGLSGFSNQVCLIAHPKYDALGGRLRDVSVDNFGNISKGDLPQNCGGGSDDVTPEPTPEPTVTPTPAPEFCSLAENVDKPECFCNDINKNTNPSKYKAICENDDTVPDGDNQCLDDKGQPLGIPPLTACSGNCHGGKYWACSGNCENSALCGTGCSGNCDGVFIYKGACSGNCNDAKIWINSGQEYFPVCSGNCKGVTVVLPKDWQNRDDLIPICTNKTDKGKNKKCLCDSQSGNSRKCNGFKVQYHK